MQTMLEEIDGRTLLVTREDQTVLATREIRIHINYWTKPDPCRDFDWEAFDDLSYDGAPDAGTLAHIVGYGANKEEAIADLVAQHIGHDFALNYDSRRDMRADERRWAFRLHGETL